MIGFIAAARWIDKFLPTDSFWALVDGSTATGDFTLVTGWRLPPTWLFRPLISGIKVLAPGPHYIMLREREDGTRIQELAFTSGFPDCQFGVPATNVTLEQRVLELETQTNNRVSALSQMVDAMSSTVSSLNATVSSVVSASLSAYDVTLQSQMEAHKDEAVSRQQSAMAITNAVSSAITAATSRLNTVASFSSGIGGNLPQQPIVQASGNDITVTAAAGGTVRVSGGQCQTDVCGLAGQVAALTDALRQV
eukprot:m.40985 g.40985  ORF g.40985 m.40985 type:complete len:251 (+) comp14066_c0_seq1:548-1300(+)